MEHKQLPQQIRIKYIGVRVKVTIFNATFSNISAMPWWSVLLVEETRVPGENHRPVASQWQSVSHNFVLDTPRLRFELTPLVVKIYSQSVIHLYYLSTMSIGFLHDLFYFISLFEVNYSDILNKELLWLWTLISCLRETNVAGEDILTKQNNYDFNIQIRGRYWLTVFELDTWASNIFINHRLGLILFHMSLKDMART